MKNIIKKVINGKHYNRTIRAYNKSTVEAPERLPFEEFVAAVIQIHNPCALLDII
jgi:hypothetical protein